MLRNACLHKVCFLLTWLMSALTLSACGLEESLKSEKGNGPMVVLFDIDGALPQFATSMFLGTEADSQFHIEKMIRKAASDILVQEIIFRIGAPQIGWARAGELSDAIAAAAKKKPVTCVIESADNMMYWMAARSCPRLLAAPAGSVDLVGISAESVFVKELLDSIGVTADVLAIGRYKSAAESVTRTGMSEASREATTALLDSLHGELVAGIASGRKLPADSIGELIDNGPYTAVSAKGTGLVDDVQSIGSLMETLSRKYEGGVVTDYGKEPPKPMEFSDVLKMLSGQTPATTGDTKPKIAIIPIIGTIQSGRQGESIVPSEDGVYDVSLIETLVEAAEDESVKAVVLRIDSPGGSALASDNIWEAVQSLAKIKPVIASMGDVAASGGYYIASAATEVVASRTTITGSIGVIGGKVVIQQAAQRWGVASERISRGRNAGMLSPFQPFSDADRELLTKHMNHVYDLFITRVSTGRGLEADEVRKHAEGRVWSGTDAIKHKLVGKAGSLDSAVQRAREMLKDSTIPASLYPRPKNFFEVLAEQLSGTSESARIMSNIPGATEAMTLHRLLTTESVLAVSPRFLFIR